MNEYLLVKTLHCIATDILLHNTKLSQELDFCILDLCDVCFLFKKEVYIDKYKCEFHPAGSLSFSYCLLSLLAWSASTRFLWLKTAAGQPGLGSHAIRSTGSQIKRGVVRGVNLLRRKGLVFDRRDHIGGSISNRS